MNKQLIIFITLVTFMLLWSVIGGVVAYRLMQHDHMFLAVCILVMLPVWLHIGVHKSKHVSSVELRNDQA